MTNNKFEININDSQKDGDILRNLFYVLFTHKWKIVGIALLVTIPVTLYVLTQPFMYQSNAKILIKMREESLNINRDVAVQMLGAGRNVKEHVNTEMAILRSQVLLEDLVEQIGVETILENQTGPIIIAKNFVKNTLGMEKELPDWEVSEDVLMTPKYQAIRAVFENLEMTSEENIIEISYVSPKPELSHEVLSTLLTLYKDRHIEVLKPDIQADFFLTEHNKLENQLQDKENQLKDFKVKHNIEEIVIQKRNLISQIGSLALDLTLQRSKEKSILARIETLKDRINNTDPYYEKDASQSTLAMDFLRKKIAELELQEVDLASKYPDDSRYVVDIRNQIALAKEKLQQEKDELQSQNQTLTTLDPVVNPKLALQVAKTELKETQARIASLVEERQKFTERLQELSGYEVVVNQLNREIANYQDSLNKVQDNLQRSEITAALETQNVSNLRVIQPPNMPVEPSKTFKERYRNVLMAIFFGLAGGFGLVFFLHYFDRRYYSSSQLESDLGIPVLCTLKKGELK